MEISAYITKYDPAQSADGMLAFSRETGGFTLLSIEHSTPDAVSFKVMGRSDHLTAYGSLRLAGTAPPKVQSLNIRALPPGAKVDDTPLDGAARQRTIDAVSKQLTEFYVYPDVGKQMIEALQGRAVHGDYNSLTDGNEFASRLTDDLRAVSRDRHLFIGYQPFTTSGGAGAAGPHTPSAEDKAASAPSWNARTARLRRRSCCPATSATCALTLFRRRSSARRPRPPR